MTNPFPAAIDAHHHLWEYSPDEYPWIPPDSRLAGDYLAPDLKETAGEAGICGTVVVQARQTLEETSWLLRLASEPNLVRGVVGWLPLADTKVEEPLERLSGNALLKGVRHVLQDEPDEAFIRKDFHRGLSLLPKYSLVYDLLLFERQLESGLALVDRQPGLPIVIDHIAKPEIQRGVVSANWKKGMKALAERENVVGVKISGMVTEVRDPEIDEATLQTYFDETLALFGPERLMFGTDWPVCLLRIDSGGRWRRMVERFAHQLSSAEKAALFFHNANRVYQLQMELPLE
jgi:L-fuconolactonase